MRTLLLSALITAALSATALAAPLERVGQPSRPLSDSVMIPAGSKLVFLAGSTPSRTNPTAPAGAPAVYGDTKTQAISAFTNMEAALKPHGMTLADVVMMRIFLVADPAKGAPDYAGMNEAYRQFFGTAAQPNKPARMSMEVKSLAGAGVLIEIDAQAAQAGS